MMASTKQGLASAVRGVCKALDGPTIRAQCLSLEQQFRSLRLSSPTFAVPGSKRGMATTSDPISKQYLTPFTAAPPIDVSKLSLSSYKLARHARTVPATPCYFSRTPVFEEHFLEVYKLSRAYRHLPTINSSEAERVAWKSLIDVQRELGESVKATEYAECMKMVKRLHLIHPDLKPGAIHRALRFFMRNVQGFLNVAKPIVVDQYGRTMGVGRRKSSVARVWLVEGDGQVLINGRTLADYFGRVHDRESAIWALYATDRVDKYNVWARVEGGGTTGQAEALKLAIAKALLGHEPALKPHLRRGESSSCMLLLVVSVRSLLICHRSWHHHARPEVCGEEEARPCQVQEEPNMGQEIEGGWQVAATPGSSWTHGVGSVVACTLYCIQAMMTICTIYHVKMLTHLDVPLEAFALPEPDMVQPSNLDIYAKYVQVLDASRQRVFDVELSPLLAIACCESSSVHRAVTICILAARFGPKVAITATQHGCAIIITWSP
jgi:small subunit ribosomal protein S9